MKGYSMNINIKIIEVSSTNVVFAVKAYGKYLSVNLPLKGSYACTFSNSLEGLDSDGAVVEVDEGDYNKISADEKSVALDEHFATGKHQVDGFLQGLGYTYTLRVGQEHEYPDPEQIHLIFDITHRSGSVEEGWDCFIEDEVFLYSF